MGAAIFCIAHCIAFALTVQHSSRHSADLDDETEREAERGSKSSRTELLISAINVWLLSVTLQIFMRITCLAQLMFTL